MAKKKLPKAGDLEYTQIKELSFAYSIPDNVMPDQKEANILYEIDIIKMLSPEMGLIRFIFTINLTSQTSGKKVTGTYATEHIFKVNNFSDYYNEAEGQYEVDDGLNRALTTQAYATVRGLFFQRFNGTWFGQLILPIKMPGRSVANPGAISE